MKITKRSSSIFGPDDIIEIQLDETDMKFGPLGQLFNAYMLVWLQLTEATQQTIETQIHPFLNLASEQWQHTSTRPGFIKGIVRKVMLNGRKVLLPNHLALGHEICHEICSQHAQLHNIYKPDGTIDWERMPHLNPDEVAHVGKD